MKLPRLYTYTYFKASRCAAQRGAGAIGVPRRGLSVTATVLQRIFLLCPKELDELVAVVPPPRAHRHRYYGVLADIRQKLDHIGVALRSRLEGGANMHRSLHMDPATLAEFCRAHHICKLSLFGSQLKGSARHDSDVDLLVEFAPGHVPSMFAMARMEAQLSDLVGRKVDLRTAGDLSRYFRQTVLGEAEVQYAA